HSLRWGAGQRGIFIQELLRAVEPVPVGIRNLEERSAGPQLRKIRQLPGNRFVAFRRLDGDEALDDFEVRSRRFVYCRLNAVPEPDVTNPEEGHEGQGQHSEVKQSLTDTNRKMKLHFVTPTE